jgi:S-adenosylmethionine synthetase
MPYLFTSESVSEGHPDKVADQISDALLDEYLRHDPKSRVACETLVTTGLVVCSGEVKSKGHVDVDKIVRTTIKNIGYNKAEYRFEAESCGIITTIHEQSADINQGVDREEESDQGAGDQGMMFGYATSEFDNHMPLPIHLSHLLLMELAAIRKEGKKMKYLRPDAKAQVTIEYSDKHKPLRIETLVLSTQHDEWVDQKTIYNDVVKILLPKVKKAIGPKYARLFKQPITMHINPTGKFVIGGPHGDTGLTGRKIIVDTYGGRGAHGGGAFSGKDSSKVDRSAAYATRHIAKNMVAAGVADEALVQVAYAIGVAKPVGLFVNTYGTGKVRYADGRKMTDSEIAGKIAKLFDLRPSSIIKRYGLQNPVFSPTSTYGHFGRKMYEAEVEVFYSGKEVETREIDGQKRYFKKAKFFAWEELDMVDAITKEFGL